jgi:hypothetical protein
MKGVQVPVLPRALFNSLLLEHRSTPTKAGDIIGTSSGNDHATSHRFKDCRHRWEGHAVIGHRWCSWCDTVSDCASVKALLVDTGRDYVLIHPIIHHIKWLSQVSAD